MLKLLLILTKKGHIKIERDQFNDVLKELSEK